MMIVGVLSGDSLREYHELAGGAPVSLIQPPVIWLSAPDEIVSTEAVSFLSSNDDVEVNMEPALFRNLLNPATGISGLYAACLPEVGDALGLRNRIGVESPDPDFVPSFLIVHDAMRSLASRRFFRSFNTALGRRRLTFTLFLADQDNPDHKVLYDNYNSEVNHEMSSYIMMRKPGGSAVMFDG